MDPDKGTFDEKGEPLSTLTRLINILYATFYIYFKPFKNSIQSSSHIMFSYLLRYVEWYEATEMKLWTSWLEIKLSLDCS